MPLNHTQCCAIGSFRVQLLPHPHFIERVHRTATYLINLVETPKFAVYHAVAKGTRRRDSKQVDNYKYFKNYVQTQKHNAEREILSRQQQQESELQDMDRDRLPDDTTPATLRESTSSTSSSSSSPCVQVTLLPCQAHRQSPDVMMTFRCCACGVL